jgi:hypothetical protein
LEHKFAAKTAKVADNGLKTNIGNLRAAQHRYESYATPGGRTVLWIDALIDLADEMLLDSNPEYVAKADYFLTSLNSEVTDTGDMCEQRCFAKGCATTLHTTS